MTAPHADQLIDGYLARLRIAAIDLPTSVRDELVEDMGAHIAEARAREPEETDATILNILDRLGDPEVLVAEARQRPTPAPSTQASVAPWLYRSGIIEISAIVLLPFLWVIGVILLWVSPAWNTRDKVIGTIFSLGGYPGILIIGASFARHVFAVTSGGNSCTSSADSSGNIGATVCTGMSIWQVIGVIVSVVFAVLIFLLPVITSAYLAIRLRWGRRRQQPALA
jgi:uncharacterized membrane protein